MPVVNAGIKPFLAPLLYLSSYTFPFLSRSAEFAYPNFFLLFHSFIIIQVKMVVLK